MSNQCTTHHHACDCREAKFQRLLEAAKKAWPIMEPVTSKQDETAIELIEAIKECDK